jgi:hypothetical protein
LFYGQHFTFRPINDSWATQVSFSLGRRWGRLIRTRRSVRNTLYAVRAAAVFGAENIKQCLNKLQCTFLTSFFKSGGASAACQPVSTTHTNKRASS